MSCNTINTIAYLGPRGTFTEQAVIDLVANNALPSTRRLRGLQAGQDMFVPCEVHLKPVDSPRSALDQVRNGTVDYAVVALESAVDGSVTQTSDALVAGDAVQIFAETVVPVEFSIMVRPGMSIEQVQTISCHPVAHAQVREWLSNNMPQARFVAAASNGAAAELVAAGEVDAAAAPARAAELNQLDVLADGVADVKGAFTRFVLVGRPDEPTPRSGHDRTSIVLTLHNRPASLQEALMELSMRGVDLSRIESRPLRCPSGSTMGMYVFHIDMVGHIIDDAVAEALAALHRKSQEVRFLGSWPVADTGLSMHEGTAPPSFKQSWEQVRSWARIGHAGTGEGVTVGQ